MTMKVMGIDPGLASTGIGIVEGSGAAVRRFAFCCITTGSRQPLGDRLNRIYAALQDLLREEQPELMVLEDVYSHPDFPRSAIALGQVTGILLLAGRQAEVPAVSISVREAKQALTGNGNSTKQQLELAVRRRLRNPVPIRPFHASDALGLALIGLFRTARRRC